MTHASKIPTAGPALSVYLRLWVKNDEGQEIHDVIWVLRKLAAVWIIGCPLYLVPHMPASQQLEQQETQMRGNETWHAHINRLCM